MTAKVPTPEEKASPDRDPGSILSFLKGIPILGGLAGDGVRSSGATAGSGAVGIILALDITPLQKAYLIAGLAAVWMISGSIKQPPSS